MSSLCSNSFLREQIYFKFKAILFDGIYEIFEILSQVKGGTNS